MAELYYIVEDDVKAKINDDEWELITKGLDHNWHLAHNETKEEINSYIGHRFDMDAEFIGFTETSTGTAITAAVGAKFYQTTTKKFYTCILAASSKDLTNATYFTEGDSRNWMIKRIFIDIMLYRLFAHITPHNIPTIRKELYNGNNSNRLEGAIYDLKRIKDGDYINLTARVNEDGEEMGHIITFGNVSTQNYKR